MVPLAEHAVWVFRNVTTLHSSPDLQPPRTALRGIPARSSSRGSGPEPVRGESRGCDAPRKAATSRLEVDLADCEKKDHRDEGSQV